MKKVIKSLWSKETGLLLIYVQINESKDDTAFDDVSFEVLQEISKKLTKGWPFPKYSQALKKFKELEGVK